MSKLATTIRWAARLVSVPVILVMGYSIIVCALPGPGQSLPGNLKDVIAYTALVVSILGLAVSWKWELAGSVLTLSAALICESINWRALLQPPFNIIAIIAVLFLLSGWLGKRREVA